MTPAERVAQIKRFIDHAREVDHPVSDWKVTYERIGKFVVVWHEGCHLKVAQGKEDFLATKILKRCYGDSTGDP
jgi:hypothetical protein